ncbi:MAG: hypothetical protein AAF915_27805 [Cyanobacteria bacterium P01_D01_bin.50]
MNLMTWNMQGAGTSSDPKAKWKKLADWLLSQPNSSRPNIVALQECGVVPDKLPGTYVFDRDISGSGWVVKLYRWTAQNATGTENQVYYVSYSELDKGANRVNLAIVTEANPTNAITIWSNLIKRYKGLTLF